MSPVKIENLVANMVIIGSGSGLVAAAAATEKGVTDIVVLEKQEILGGHSNWAQGLDACDSPIQKQAQVATDRDDRFKSCMTSAHWARVDPRIARACIDKSGDTIRWFQDKGVNFDLKVHFANNRIRSGLWPLKGKGPDYGRGAELIKAVTRECKEKGVTLLLRTRAKRILRDAKGKVTGVVAVKGRKEFQIKTGCVIIATGGFAGNKELLKKYCPDYYDGMHIREMSELHTGDGLLMAAEVGASIPNLIAYYVEGPHPNYVNKKESLAASMKEPISGIIKEPYTVWINKKGRRFIDETAGLSLFEAGNAILMQPDRVMYSLIDDKIRQDVEEKGMLVGRGWGKEEKGQRVAVPGFEEVLRRRDAEGGDTLVKIADTWDGIARWIGADPKVLKAEIEAYNACCDRGYDPIFVKDRKYLLPLRKPPFYAIRCITSLGGTLGGIKVNERMEVLDTRYNVIPGLFVAGVAADGWAPVHIGADGCSSPFGFAMNSGRMAGESAAEYVLGKS